MIGVTPRKSGLSPLFCMTLIITTELKSYNILSEYTVLILYNFGKYDLVLA